MGYTHYWTWKKRPSPETLRAAMADMAKIVAVGEKEGLVKVSKRKNAIWFDGTGETFVFPGRTGREAGVPATLDGFNFTKTGAEPYDKVVTACLLVVAEKFPSEVVEVKSDGDFGSPWDDGRALFYHALGRAAPRAITTLERKADNDDE